MNEIRIVTDLFGKDFVVISNDDGSFTSMPKSTYDEMIANQTAHIEGKI